jgi:hypothetical protein
VTHGMGESSLCKIIGMSEELQAMNQQIMSKSIKARNPLMLSKFNGSKDTGAKNSRDGIMKVHSP